MPGFSLSSRFRDVDDRAVGGDVLHDDGLQPDLRHRAVEVLGRICVDAECDLLARPDAADVRLVDVRVDLHLGQVGGNHEQVGACMLAATVWPTSTLRCVTMPSIGARITV